MNKTVKMIFGTQRSTQTESSAVPSTHLPPRKTLPTDALLSDVQNSLAAGMEKMTAKERERTIILSEKTQTIIHLNDDLLPYHDRCRVRSMEAFGCLQYGPLLHVGISRIRAMVVQDRLALIALNTLTKQKGKPTALKMSKACYLDWQRLWIQVREELWIAKDSRSFGMPELIPMVDAITAAMTFAEMRQELVRITTRRA